MTGQNSNINMKWNLTRRQPIRTWVFQYINSWYLTGFIDIPQATKLFGNKNRGKFKKRWTPKHSNIIEDRIVKIRRISSLSDKKFNWEKVLRNFQWHDLIESTLSRSKPKPLYYCGKIRTAQVWKLFNGRRNVQLS